MKRIFTMMLIVSLFIVSLLSADVCAMETDSSTLRSDTLILAAKCTHKNKEKVTVVEQTCSQAGIFEWRCTDCGKVIETIYTKYARCEFGDWILDRKFWTVIDAHSTCINCGEVKYHQQMGHSVSEGIFIGRYVEVREATCSQTGLKEYWCYCCNKTWDFFVKYEPKRPPIVTEKLPHNVGDWVVSENATCTKEGMKKRTCKDCGTVETEVIPVIDHAYGDWTETRPTPEKNGKKERKCTMCLETQSESVVYDFDELSLTPVKKHFFTDVSEESWYNEVVSKCNHFGLMVGTSDTTFNPAGNITRAEVITAAVRVYCLYNPDVEKPDLEASPWYKGYVDFAVKHGIVEKDDFAHYTLPATRAEMAYVFTNAAGEDNLERINDITSIPDVNMNDKYAEEIFMLYNAGVLTGNDDAGTFSPNKNIVRSEAAAIIARICKISDRVER